MRFDADGEYNWIAHYVDHYSKFHVLWPQKEKTAEETVLGLENNVLRYFGKPKIFQSDNGREFKNEVNVKLLKAFFFEF